MFMDFAVILMPAVPDMRSADPESRESFSPQWQGSAWFSGFRLALPRLKAGVAWPE